MLAERGATVPALGDHARNCNASTKQISKAETLYTYCSGQGDVTEQIHFSFHWASLFLSFYASLRR